MHLWDIHTCTVRIKRQHTAVLTHSTYLLTSLHLFKHLIQTASHASVFLLAGIPIEEEEEEQDTSIKGRLLSLLYKIKGPPQKTEEEPTEKEQAAPSK